jgi:hypothetical protein
MRKSEMQEGIFDQFPSFFSARRSRRFLLVYSTRGVFPDPIRQVGDCKDGVPQDHSRTGVAHDRTHLLAHARLVAVYRALRAGRFLLLKRAALQARIRIVEERLAFVAQLALRAVLVAAVQLDHGFDRARFTFQASVCLHSLNLQVTHFNIHPPILIFSIG